MKNILFLNSLGEYAPITYSYAVHVAYHLGARLTSLHVYEVPSPVLWDNTLRVERQEMSYLQEFAQGQEVMARQQLQDFVREYLPVQRKKLAQELKVEGGDVLTSALKTIRTLHPELIVMGLHQHNRFSELFGPDPADWVQRLECPILLVPHQAHYTGLINLLYLTDVPAQADVKAFQYLNQWVKVFHPEVEVLCLEATEITSPQLDPYKIAMQQALGHRRPLIVWTDAGDGIWNYEDRQGEAVLKYAEEREADLIVIKAGHQGFWGHLLAPDTGVQVLHRTKIPVLIGAWG
jgi:nucleotide-binding universal stress UspA family protein